LTAKPSDCTVFVSAPVLSVDDLFPVADMVAPKSPTASRDRWPVRVIAIAGIGSARKRPIQLRRAPMPQVEKTPGIVTSWPPDINRQLGGREVADGKRDVAGLRPAFSSTCWMTEFCWFGAVGHFPSRELISPTCESRAMVGVGTMVLAATSRTSSPISRLRAPAGPTKALRCGLHPRLYRRWAFAVGARAGPECRTILPMRVMERPSSYRAHRVSISNSPG